jgi:hypothetical protein
MNLDADFALYGVFQSTIGDQIGTLVTSIPDNAILAYIVTGLNASTTYYFTVRVVDNLGLYSDSNQVSATTLGGNSPPQVVILASPTDITPNTITLAWSQNNDSDFVRYEVFVSTTGGQLGSLTEIVSSRILTGVVVSGLSPSTTYYFTVRVLDTGLLYSDSNQVSGVTLPPNVPPSAVLLGAPTEITNNSVRLTWSESVDGDFATYDILVSTTFGIPGTSVTKLTAINKTSYIVTGLYQNTDYHFSVRVTDVGGLFADSNQETARTLPNDNPPIPVTLSNPLNIADYTMTLRWTPNADPDFARFDIYRSEDSIELGILVDTITVQSVTEYVMVDLQPETMYYFVVRVVDAGLQVADSNQVSGTTLAAAASVANDTDNDGLPDDWEREHFNDLTEGALGDPDGDGIPNIVEYHDDTDPNVPDEKAEPGLLDQYLWIIMLILALIFLVGMLAALSGKRKLRNRVSREKAARRALVAKHKRELDRLQPLLIPEVEAQAPPPPETTPPPPEVQEAPPKKVAPRKKVTPKKKAKVKPRAKKAKVTPKEKIPPPPDD